MILGLMLWNRNVFYGSCADNKCGMELTCDAFNRMLCRLMVWLNFHYDWKCHYGRSAWTIANRECFDRWNCKFPNQSHITVETYREPTIKHNCDFVRSHSKDENHNLWMMWMETKDKGYIAGCTTSECVFMWFYYDY